MKLKLLTSALFNFRNISILILCMAIAYVLGEYEILPFISGFRNYLYTAAGAAYIISVMQCLFSKSFNEDFNRKQKINNIKELNYICRCLANEAKHDINPVYFQKLKKVMDDKNEIYESFFRGEYSYLKEKIVEQTLKLVISYVKLLHNFCIRNKDINNTDISEIINRLNMNNRKLTFTKDPVAIENIKNVIEIDEKTISRFKEEKNELERMSAKLDYIESTVNMFKHRLLSNIESEEMLENLEAAVNEASALETVLEERKHGRMKA